MEFNFLQSEWTYAAGTLFFMVVAWKVDANKKEQEKKDEKLLERVSRLQASNAILKPEFRQNWAKIASYPEDNKGIFKTKFTALKNDELRTCIYHVIDILTDVYSNYEEQGFKIEKSIWKKTFNYAFNPHKMTVIVDAYQKYKKKGQFSESFVKYVDQIINEHERRGNVEEDQ